MGSCYDNVHTVLRLVLPEVIEILLYFRILIYLLAYKLE